MILKNLRQKLETQLKPLPILLIFLTAGASPWVCADEISSSPTPNTVPKVAASTNPNCTNLSSNDSIESCCSDVLKDKSQENSQLTQQCKAFEYAQSAIILDSVMLGIDAGTLAVCAAACAVGASPFNLVCETAAVAAGAADVITGIVQMAKSSDQMSTMDQLMAGAGIGMGVVGIGTGGYGAFKSGKNILGR